MLLLLQAIEDDNDRAFISQLYEELYPIMKYKVYLITRDYHVVDDIINDAFIRLFDKISILRSLDCCKRTSYIVNTVRNVSLNHIKKRKAENHKRFLQINEEMLTDLPDTAATTEEIYIKYEEYEELGKAILKLKERDRDLLYNKYILELSDKEISELMNIPVDNIREYLVRARRRALKIMGDEMVNDNDLREGKKNVL
jgi:RNA polymerase sigma-70 factor (ECF subfamily)